MEKTDIKVFTADISPLYNEEVFRRYLNELPKERQKKALGYSDSQNAARSVGAYVLLRRALESEGNKDKPDIGYTECGKPYLKGDYGISFSLSHSGDYAACCISKCDVGIDIQKIRQIDFDIAKRFFSEREYESITSHENENRVKLFFSIWVLKESLAKAMDSSLMRVLGSDSIVPADKKDSFMTCDKQFSLKLLECPDGYKMAVCHRGDSFARRLLKVEL